MVGKNARLISPSVRRVHGIIETFEDDINLEYITQDDYLKTITIERVGEEGKFFGFGICQKLNTHLTKSDYPITTATTIKATIYDDLSFYSDMFPPFKVTEVHKDENSGELSITAYDAIYRAAEHTIDEVNTTVTTIEKFVQDIAIFLGCDLAGFEGTEADEACFNTVYNETALANYEGTETIRSVLDDIAEATQTIYYINYQNYLIFKRLDKDGVEALTITKDDYITLDSGENRRLTNLVSATELGDNLTATLKEKASGTTVTVDDVSENAHTVEVIVTSKNKVKSFIREAVATEDTNVLFIDCDLKPNTRYTISFTAAVGSRFYLNNYITTSIHKRTGTGERQSITFYTKRTLGTDNTFYIEGKGWIIAKNDVGNTIVPNFANVQLEEGSAVTDYAPYVAPEAVTVSVAGVDGSAATYTPDAEGIVSGVASVAPTMIVTSNSAGALISIKYEKSNTISGTTQYIRNNPFWDLRADRAELVDEALATVWGMTINQFDCVWRGNPALEIGDKIALITKDNEEVKSYVLNDVIDYSGGLTQRTSWHYTESEETASNPSNLGELLTQTYAKVDKVNKRIEMVVSATDGNTETLNQLISDKDGIVASVEKVEKKITDELAPITSDIAELTKSVEAQITANDVQLQINSALDNGINKVTTSTGYTFNEEGLTVEKSGSEMKTTISDDGMRVYRNEHEVLTADNKGVKAENLHATTYLIIGNNSRFEDYGGRTGCFWIG